jgi:hypothetical protein
MADDTLTLSIPRSALTVVAPPPEYVHQKTVGAVVGLPARQYLALCRAGAWPVVCDGKLRLARREEVVAYLDGRARILARRAALASVAVEPFSDADMPRGLTRATKAHRNRL